MIKYFKKLYIYKFLIFFIYNILKPILANSKRTLYFEFKKLNVLKSIKEINLDFEILGDYLITTDKGIFRACKNTITKISSLNTFGITIFDHHIYVTSSVGEKTFILKEKLENILQRNLHFWDEIYSVNISSEAGRFHQIGNYDKNIWIANTAQNLITKINNKGEWLGNLGPFFCSYGHPINIDHNHINSVFATKNYLIFTAFKANKNSVIGLIGSGKILLFKYKNMGVHDCMVDGKKFIFCDSFRFWDNVHHGNLMCGKLKIDEKFLIDNDSNCLRGVASFNGEFLVGSSNYGDRKRRYQNSGNVLFGKKNKFFKAIKIGASQINDILRVDGYKNDNQISENKKFSEVRLILKRIFGKPIETLNIEDCMIGQNAKKFDESDGGDFLEYLDNKT